MRRFLVSAAMTVAAFGFAAARPRNPCHRACLEEIVNRCPAAMVDQAPSQAPFAKTYGMTENVAPIRPTDGLWFTSTGLTNYEICFADPEGGQAAFVGLVREAEKNSLVWPSG